MLLGTMTPKVILLKSQMSGDQQVCATQLLFSACECVPVDSVTVFW